MRLILSADWHIMSSTPRSRTDDVPMVQFNKIEWICDLANNKDAAVLVAGDIFDKPHCPLPLLYKYMALFMYVRNGVYTIYGQHDLHFHHADIARTPYGILMLSGAIKSASEIMDVCNFGDDIPEKNSHELCAHIPITKYEPPFYMEDAFSAKDFMLQHKEYGAIITGDFHEHHITETDDQILFNPGPILRADKSKQSVIPKVIYYDTISCEYEVFDIPIEQDVFNLDLMDKDDRSDHREKMREYANSMEVDIENADFVSNVQKLVKVMKPSDQAKKVIDEIIEEVCNE